MSNDARSQARNGQELYFYQRGRLRAIATRLRVPHSMRSGSILRIFYLSFRNIDKHLSGRESQVSNKLRNCCFFFYETFAENGVRALFYFAQKHRRPHAVCLTLLRHLPHACINFPCLFNIIRFLPNVANSFRENMSVSVDHSGI